MAERPTKVQVLPGAPQADGFEVEVEESTERWSHLKLADGSSVRVKPVIATIIRVKDQYDQDGNPIYVIKGSMAFVVDESPKNLRKPA